MSLPSKYMALAGHIRPKPTEATIAIERCTLSDSEGGIEGSERDIEVDVTGRVEYDAGRDEFEARLLTATEDLDDDEKAKAEEELIEVYATEHREEIRAAREAAQAEDDAYEAQAEDAYEDDRKEPLGHG